MRLIHYALLAAAISATFPALAWNECRLMFSGYEGKETLLACSSPLTGFITPPDMDKSHIRKDSKSKLIFGSKPYEYDTGTLEER